MDNPFDAVMGFKAKVIIIAVSFTTIFVCSWVGYAEQGRAEIDAPSSHTLYTFEISRNGHDKPCGYQERNYMIPGPRCQLTPQGIRQKYLQGMYNRFKADHAFGYNASHTNFSRDAYKGINVIALNANRAIASAFAEMQGFQGGELHPGLILTENQAERLRDEQVITVPFKTRKSKELDTALGNNSTYMGYNAIPVYNSMKTPRWDNPIERDSCHFIETEYQLRWDSQQYDDQTVFHDVMPLFHKLRYKFAWVMHLSDSARDDMTYHDAFDYANLVEMQRFYDIPQEVGWTAEDELDMNLTIKWGLDRPLTNRTKNIFITKVLAEPIATMVKIVAEVGINKTPYADLNTTKMDVYAIQQEQMNHIMWALMPLYGWVQMKYAAVIRMELRINNDCFYQLSGTTSDFKSCFKIRMRYNGDFIDFRSSTIWNSTEKDDPNGINVLKNEEDQEVVYDIMWSEFMDIFNEKILYRGDLKEKCDSTFNPNDTNGSNYTTHWPTY